MLIDFHILQNPCIPVIYLTWSWCRTSLVAQMVKHLLTMQENRFNPLVGKILWRRKWQPTPVLLPGKSHGQRSLVGYNSWGRKKSDMTMSVLTCCLILFARILLHLCSSVILPIIFFFPDFSWFWYQGDCGLEEWVSKYFSLCNILEEFQKTRH